MTGQADGENKREKVVEDREEEDEAVKGGVLPELSAGLHA